MKQLSVERLRYLLQYEEGTGIFRWVRPTNQRIRVGQEAGRLNHHGYIEITLDGVLYSAHRLAWLYFYGHPPTEMIDHINGAKADNRIANLRASNSIANGQNQRKASKKNACRLIGAHFHKKTEKWRSNITVNGKQKTLGSFDTAIDAHLAYVNAKRKLHTGCTI